MRYTRTSLYPFRPFCQHPILPEAGLFSAPGVHLFIGLFAPSDIIKGRLHRRLLTFQGYVSPAKADVQERSQCGSDVFVRAKGCHRPFHYNIDGECDSAPYYRMKTLILYLCPHALCPPGPVQKPSPHPFPKEPQPRDQKMNERTQFAITSTTPFLSNEFSYRFRLSPTIRPRPIFRAMAAYGPHLLACRKCR